ncbi:hypothetical protein WR25_08392 [Diploscapter pachys]|uniref:Protein kinase domain-containing protein n=1 Tax=Diploscapter pachys TaxID=2018661 RepID=A0A2A2JP41_9BILA|nr:hypothetical protein WR25_08392 [Diploscapter pachys]
MMCWRYSIFVAPVCLTASVLFPYAATCSIPAPPPPLTSSPASRRRPPVQHSATKQLLPQAANHPQQRAREVRCASTSAAASGMVDSASSPPSRDSRERSASSSLAALPSPSPSPSASSQQQQQPSTPHTPHTPHTPQQQPGKRTFAHRFFSNIFRVALNRYRSSSVALVKDVTSSSSSSSPVHELTPSTSCRQTPPLHSPRQAEAIQPEQEKCTNASDETWTKQQKQPNKSRSASGSGGLTVNTALAARGIQSSLSPPSPHQTVPSSSSTTTLSSLTTLTSSSSNPGSAQFGMGPPRISQSISMQFAGTPKSPKTARLVHEIPHKWHKSTKFRLNSDAICNLCTRPLGFGFINAWEKCSSCKMKVHTHCKTKMGDSCGLRPEHIRALFDQMIQQTNGNMWNEPISAVPVSRSLNESAFQYPDTAIDSSSSTNSSAPSTPALPLGLGVNSPYYLPTAPARSEARKFLFPEPVPEQQTLPIVLISGEQSTSSYSSNNSIGGFSRGAERRTSRGFSLDGIAGRLDEDSEGTVVVGSQGSATDTILSDGSGGGRSPGGHTWDRHRWNMSTIRGPNAQASWNEVTIPFSEIKFSGLVGNGRFGHVMAGYHFGDVAVKFLNMDHTDEGKKLDDFKADVAAHKNARHDNIVLFLGYCLESDRLGIVMSYCRGPSLHTLLHVNMEKFDISTILVIAQQICQGVSYLHTKKILHKDLRSKNLFIESKNKVVITDFGLFSMKRLKCPPRGYSFQVPNNWLAYLAPELIRSMAPDCHELPFTESSDIYAFSTIWYELLTRNYPFARELSDVIIYKVGHGIKPPLSNISTIREEILTRCWRYDPSERPLFSDILVMLNSLPKKRLDRSPSFPVIRSYESIF